MTSSGLTDLDLPLKRIGSGKVREIFDLGNDQLLFVASDRISAFDVIMAEPIPDKGKLLTGMSLFWFDLLSDVCPNHLVSAEASGFPEVLAAHTGVLAGRSMVVKRLQMLPIELVVRGYLVGSGWKDYQATGAVCGIGLPAGLQQAEKLPEPIFTPATKADIGHDENISEDQAADMVGPDVLKTAKGYAIDAYKKAADHAASRGIILADTKFEFGMLDGQVVLGDEVLTPDSSRFWPAASWSPGTNPPSYDKQMLRDWLDASGWKHDPPPPAIPQQIIDETRSKYVEAYEQLTGRSFEEYLAGG